MKRLDAKIFLTFLFVCALFTRSAFPGITGKVAGQIIDQETGQPIAGANVFIVGTTLGAASDLDGIYTILNVPPGEYDISTIVVGYAEMTIKEVRVIVDQTARINFQLKIELIEGETVVVIADRHVVKADVSTSTSSMASEEIETLPMLNIESVVGLQAGIEDGLVIRGGAAELALFQIDGLTLRDPRNNTPITNVPISGLQEVSVERGGFNAEYGQVRSGIVNIVTKEGDNDFYFGNAIARVSPPEPKYYGTSPYDANSTMLRPYLDPAVAWTGTGNGVWDEYTRRQYPDFDGWNELSRQFMTDSDPNNDLSPAAAQELFRWQHRRREANDQPDYNIDVSLGGPIPVIGEDLGNLRFFTSYRNERNMLLLPLSRGDYKDYFWSLKLNSDITPALKLTITTQLGKSYYVAQNESGVDLLTNYIVSSQQIAQQISNMDFPRATDSRLFADSYYSTGHVSFSSVAARITHALSNTSFYEAGLEFISRRYSIEPIRLRDMTENVEYVPGQFTNESPFGWSPIHDPGVDGMMTGGHTSTARDFSEISAILLRFDYSNQLNPSNLLKTGFEIVYNKLDLNYGEVKLIYIDGNTFIKRKDQPLRLSAYVQDKLEFESLVINAGIRMDYTYSNTEWVDVEPFDKEFYSSNYLPGTIFPTVEAEPELIFSPRLGVSHPITEDSKLFFNYGHFLQLPTYEQILRLSRNGSNAVEGIGDPNLRLENTIAYELGYDHALWDDYLLQVAGFYRDIFWERDYTTFISADASINYDRATNNLYEDVRGFEITFRKPRGRWWTTLLNYTYQVGTAGHFDQGTIFQDPSEQRDYDRNTRNMYQERPIPQPYARAQVNVFTPHDIGSTDIQTILYADWSFNLLFDWRSGPWLTWNPSRQINVAQNVKGVDWYNLQFRLMKKFYLNNDTSLSLFVDVYNALNTKRLSLNSFYDGFDYSYYFESLHLPASNDYNNIVGDDKVGDYRDPDIPFQPIEQVGDVYELDMDDISTRAIYYDRSSGQYMNYVNGDWAKVDDGKMNKVLDEKAYIDMPNHTYFHFLDLRRIFYGVTITFQL